MVLFFSITLLISIIGLISLFAIKQWELRTGNLVFAGVRPWVGTRAHRLVLWTERVLPGLLMSSTKRAARGAESHLHRAAAHGLLAAEHGLEQVLVRLRGMTEAPRASRGEASEFLREVAEHKRKLLSRKVRTIREE